MRNVLFDPILRDSEMLIRAPWRNLNLWNILVSYGIPLAIFILIMFVLKYMYRRKNPMTTEPDEDEDSISLPDI